eukprot:scaffold113305_cov40-Tisochrysis_lutea.AAC.2
MTAAIVERTTPLLTSDVYSFGLIEARPERTYGLQPTARRPVGRLTQPLNAGTPPLAAGLSAASTGIADYRRSFLFFNSHVPSPMSMSHVPSACDET